MRILIVPDSFKGSTSSIETARCLQAGLRSVFPSCTTRLFAVADGGEGTVDALLGGVGGKRVDCTVQGPLGDPVRASLGLLSDGWAVVEMAQASGLPLVPPHRRDPSIASTYGTGQLIRKALDLGFRRILVGMGGSATNDGGAGMARALGARFLDGLGEELPPGGGALSRLERIDRSGLDPRLRDAQIIAASDVTNPLCGPQGASAVYGPQKGADPSTVRQLDRALERYGQVLAETFGQDFAQRPGAGAAGGLGAGLMAFCGAELLPGIDVLFQRLDLDSQVRWADLILTGEGRADATSASGKLLSGIGRLAKQHGKPVIAFVGSLGPGWEELTAAGIDAVIPIQDGPVSLEASLSDAPRLLTGAAARAARLLQLGQTL